MAIKGKPSSSARRKYPGVGGRRHNPVKVLERREYSKLRESQPKEAPVVRLIVLDARLGHNAGAQKERARLLATIAFAPSPV